MAIRAGDEALAAGPLNKPLLGAVALPFVLQLFAIYTLLFQGFLETEPLPGLISPSPSGARSLFRALDR